jgi:hypothetical protein
MPSIAIKETIITEYENVAAREEKDTTGTVIVDRGIVVVPENGAVRINNADEILKNDIDIELPMAPKRTAANKPERGSAEKIVVPKKKGERAVKTNNSIMTIVLANGKVKMEVGTIAPMPTAASNNPTGQLMT